MRGGGKIPLDEKLAQQESHLQRGLDTHVQEEVQECALLGFKILFLHITCTAEHISP